LRIKNAAGGLLAFKLIVKLLKTTSVALTRDGNSITGSSTTLRLATLVYTQRL
jgi:hypothetical protein